MKLCLDEKKKHALLQEQDCFTSILILQVYLVS